MTPSSLRPPWRSRSSSSRSRPSLRGRNAWRVSLDPAALHGSGLDEPKVVPPGVAGGAEQGDGAGHQRGAPAQAFVVPGALGDIGEHGAQFGAGVAQPPRLARVAEQRLHHCQGDQLGIVGPGGYVHCRALGRQARVGHDLIVDGDVKCGGEGVKVGVHVVPPGPAYVIPPISAPFARRLVDGRALSGNGENYTVGTIHLDD
jgi:hypothetical protein